MKTFKKLVLAAGLSLVVGAAVATPFSITGVTFTPGTGYGQDVSETAANATLLDVRFNNNPFNNQNFQLNTVGAFKEFTAGRINFQEPNGNQGIRASETDNLDVSVTLNFTAPGVVNNTLTTTGVATIGVVNDADVDFSLIFASISRSFGNTGSYTVSFAPLSFTDQGPQELIARVTLDALDTASVPEPGTVALLAIAFVGAGMWRRKTSK